MADTHSLAPARAIEALKLAIARYERLLEDCHNCGDPGVECPLQDAGKDYHLAGELLILKAALSEGRDPAPSQGWAPGESERDDQLIQRWRQEVDQLLHTLPSGLSVRQREVDAARNRARAHALEDAVNDLRFYVPAPPRAKP